MVGLYGIYLTIMVYNPRIVEAIKSREGITEEMPVVVSGGYMAVTWR